jgi:hypothetical protein
MPFIINVWEIEFLKESQDTSRFDALLQYHLDTHEHKNGKSASGLNPMDIVQQYIFGCSAFTGKDGTAPANFYEAAERITYLAINNRHTPLGNWLNFGPFDSVLKPSYVRNNILTTPQDSGHYYVHAADHVCAGWPNCTVGTIDHYQHILFSHISNAILTKNVGACPTQMEFVRDMVCESRSRNTFIAKGRNTSTCQLEQMTYIESNVLGTVVYPEGVKMVIVSFADFFGSAFGSDIRDWCARYGWALTWALYEGVYNSRTNACEDPRRLLDPYVLAQGNIRTNASISAAYTNAFAELWSEASEQWDFTGRNGDNQSQWRNFVNEKTTPGVDNALLFTFTSRECSDADNCLGVAYSSGTCVCYVTNVTD